MDRKQIQGFALIGLIAGLALVIGGCASTGGGETATADASSAEAAPAKKVEPAAVPVPKGSKLAKIEIGMSEQQVRKAIGEPDDIRIYPTGKNWIPFYFGGDTMRADWSYTKVGKVVLSNSNRWARTMKVVELRPNPDEP